MNTVLKLEKKFDEKKNRVLETNKRLVASLSKADGKLDSTGRAYMGYIKKFFEVEELDHIEYDTIYNTTDLTVVEFLNGYINENTSHSTINKVRCALARYFKTFIGYHNSNGIPYDKTNPANVDWVRDHVNKNADKTRRIKPTTKLTRQHAVEYMKVINRKEYDYRVNNPEKVRDRDMIILILGSTVGLRREEMLSVQVKDVVSNEEIGRNRIVIVGKGNKSAVVDISNNTHQRLATYIEKYRLCDDDYIVGRLGDNGQITNPDNLNKWWSKYDNDVEVVIKPHDLRRIFAGTLFNEGYTLEEIRVLMRHNSVNTTQKYLNECGLVSNRKNEISL